jgi:hypothetical protein
LNHSTVIPGKLAIPPEADQPQAEASATGSGKIKKLVDTRFPGYDGGGAPDLFADFDSKIIAVR